MKTFFWMADWSGCGTYRGIVPMNALSEVEGHETEYNNALSMEKAREFDVLIAQRTNLEAATRMFQELSAGDDVVTVFEVDDLLTQVHPSNMMAWNHYSRASHRDPLIANMRVAQGVVVSTEFLGECMREYNDNVFVFPNCIDGSIVDLPVEQGERLTIGWAGGSSHRIDLKRVAYPMKRVLRRNPDVAMHFLGDDYSAVLGVPASQRIHTPWFTGVLDYIKALNFDIGIAPLHPMAFNQAKSHIKTLEYAARGIPVVASKFGPYQDFVKHGETGFLAQYDKEWEEYVTLLINDEALRTKMSQAAQDQAREWDIRNHISRYATFLEGLK